MELEVIIMLMADCARCQGLCCVALAFDRGESFSFDKRSNEPCRHLLPTNHCAVHESLAQRGLGGCARYECHGAGQRVCEELFAGHCWRDDPELASAMFAAFRRLRDVHELLVLLHAARQLELPTARAERLEQLVADLEPVGGWTADSLTAFDVAGCHVQVHAFLRSLRDSASLRPYDRLRRLELA